MDAEKLASVSRLRSRYPSLTVSEARAILEEHNWNAVESCRAAEALVQGAVKRSDGKQQTYFVGGEGSGQEVIVPSFPHGESNPPTNMVERLFRRAAEEAASGDYLDEPQAFYGSGRRLGHTANPSPLMASTLLPRRTVTISVYTNGLRVDDGPLLDLQSDETRELLESMSRGLIPSSLAARYPNTEIVAQLREMGHPYTPPAFSAFAGSGHRLAPTEAVGDDRISCTAPATDREFHFEPEEESSSLCLVNSHGERKEFQVNPKRHTVDDIYALARVYQPEAESFVLVVRDLPPRKLDCTTRSKTVEEAKLIRAVVAIQLL